MANKALRARTGFRPCPHARLGTEPRLARGARQGRYRYELRPTPLAGAHHPTGAVAVGVGVDDLVVSDAVVAPLHVADVARGHQVLFGVVPRVAVQVVDHQGSGSSAGACSPEHLGAAVMALLRPGSQTVVQQDAMFTNCAARRGQRMIRSTHQRVVARGLGVISPSLPVGACLRAVGLLGVLHLAAVTSEARAASVASPGLHGLHLTGSEG